MSYRRPYRGTQPEYLFPPYASTVKRAPAQPLVVLPHTLSELTAPVFGYGEVKPGDSDLTKQHKDDPQGERIVVSGRVLDENSRPLPGVLIEVWQANAAGRYNHRVDQHDAPILPLSADPITTTTADGPLGNGDASASTPNTRRPRSAASSGVSAGAWCNTSTGTIIREPVGGCRT